MLIQSYGSILNGPKSEITKVAGCKTQCGIWDWKCWSVMSVFRSSRNVQPLVDLPSLINRLVSDLKAAAAEMRKIVLTEERSESMKAILGVLLGLCARRSRYSFPAQSENAWLGNIADDNCGNPRKDEAFCKLRNIPSGEGTPQLLDPGVAGPNYPTPELEQCGGGHWGNAKAAPSIIDPTTSLAVLMWLKGGRGRSGPF